MAEIDYLQAHKENLKERDELNTRRETDNKLVTSDSYQLTDIVGVPLSGMVHVTANKLRVFKAYVLASLGKANEKVRVESEDPDFDTDVIEDLITSYYKSADRRLSLRGDYLLNPQIDEQSCMRGETALEVLTQLMPAKDGNEPFVDTNITSWDTRYMSYVLSSTPFAGYQTLRTKAAIEGEQWAIESNFVVGGKTATVVKLWTPEENVFYVADTVAFRQPNPYGFIPVVREAVPIGSMLADKDSLKYQMESIFFMVRDMIDQYNMCLTILQTLNLKAIKAATQEFSKDSARKAEPYDEINAPGSHTIVDAPGAISQIPYGDAKNSMILALQEINKGIADATLSRITLGDVPGDMSAIALLQIEQGQGQVFMPRLGTRGMVKQRAAEMFIKQIIDIGQTVSIGTPGHMHEFDIKALEGQYEIEYIYTSKNPDTEFARTRMANELKDVLDEETILDEIMRRDDPQGDLRKLHQQRAIAVSPTLQKYTYLSALRELEAEGSETAGIQADLLELELNITIEDLQRGVLPDSQGLGTAPVVPAGPQNSNERASDLMQSPTEGV